MNPPEDLKSKIYEEGPVVSTYGKGRRYATAALIVVTTVVSVLAYYYWSRWMDGQLTLGKFTTQNEQIVQNYEALNQKLDKLQADLAIIENTAFRRVVMKGTANDLTAQASVYWNESTHEAYISIQNLKGIPQENQYQLWAIVKGKPVDVGVFDRNFIGLLKMKNIADAAAFAVTIEPRGGRNSPTFETMQVIGAVDRRAG